MNVSLDRSKSGEQSDFVPAIGRKVEFLSELVEKICL